MPILQSENSKKIILPSTKGTKDEAWVKIKTDITVGDISSDEFKSIKNEQDNVINIIPILTKLIIDWNYTDKDGNKLPINKDNLVYLKLRDFKYIYQVIFEELSHDNILGKDEKKV